MRSFVRSCARIAALAATLCAGCGKDEPTQQSPTAQLVDLDDQPFQLPDAVTVVVFTRTDCPIANRYAPEICRLYETYHASGVEFFLVYLDPAEMPEAIRGHLREYGYHCSGLRDPEHALAKQCGATVTPEAVVFAKDHTMTYRGRIDDRYEDLGQPRAEPTTHDLADAIEATVHGRPVAHSRTKAVGCLIADLQKHS